VEQTAKPVRIGVSACLLGDEVRFDGGHKCDRFLTDVLAPHVELVPVCPEVEMGLGTPREPMQLVQVGEGFRMITTRTGIDHTETMEAWARKRLRALDADDLCGYVLKSHSPSCGMEGVEVYGPAGGTPARRGRGLFADALMQRFPALPVVEETRLADAALRDNFIERVFAYRRLKDLFLTGWTAGDLVRFHTAHKMQLLAHSRSAYDEMGRLVSGAGRTARKELRQKYERLFMQALSLPATRARHTNVLTHMAGHLKTAIDAASKKELASRIGEYRRGLVPLAVPVTLVRHHVRAHAVEYLADQTYLEPHPRELLLRNHARQQAVGSRQ
jgi:uncharacterized protein YbgA (DUF1722 family)/uncharacterized protein YbbK (DUF523 family)